MLNETSIGERKMRSALINTLLQLNEDKKYDIAASLAADIGYKLVQISKETGFIIVIGFGVEPAVERIVPYEDCLNCFCSKEEQCTGVQSVAATPAVGGEAKPVDITEWKLVPDDPTEEMWQAGRSADEAPGDSYSKVWRAMFNAAPNVDDCETTSTGGK